MSRLTSLALMGAACLAACSGPAPSQKLQAPVKVALAGTMPGPRISPVPPGSPPSMTLNTNGLTIVAANADMPALAQTINAAGLDTAGAATGRSAPAFTPALVKVEVLLDRAGFSPGVIDGRGGDNLDHALQAYSVARGLAWTGKLERETWDSLVGSGIAQAGQLRHFAVVLRRRSDERARHVLGGDLVGPHGRSGIRSDQLLAERFHMDRKLLKALNPDADFSKAGTTIIVTAPRDGPRELQVARVEVDKTNEAIRAYDATNRLVAYYPASVGSTERPAPSGVWVVKAVAPRPAYYYDPKRLTFAPLGATGRLKIAAGPNNPVGSTWIGLSVPTYGIHGSPDPSLVGKRQSHGCVRLTNWDALELGRSVKAGTQVSFVGEEARGARA